MRQMCRCIPDPFRPCDMSGLCTGLLLVVLSVTRGLSPPMCEPVSPLWYYDCLPNSCEGCGPVGIAFGPFDKSRQMARRRPMAWLSCGLSLRGDCIVRGSSWLRLW